MKSLKNVLARSYSLTRGGSNLLFLFGMFFLIASCSKESQEIAIQSIDPKSGENYLTTSCDQCDENCYLGSVLEAIKDQEDVENDRINMILYHYGTAVRAAFKNPTYQQLILDALASDTEEAISLLELAQENPAFADFLNEQLRQSMAANNIYPRGIESGIEAQIATPGWDANAYLTSKMTKADYTYHPVIYELKPVNTVNTNVASVLIAQEVNDCDEVVGWKGETEVIFSEADANNSEDLILFVGPGKATALPSGGSILTNEALDLLPDPTASERGLATGEQLRAVSGKIKGLNYRYEKTGDSEIIAFVTGWTTDPERPDFSSNKEGQEKFEKKEIKDQVVVKINRSIAGTIESPSTSNFFVGFYEYDWYIAKRNLKKVKCPCNSSVPDAELAMKYAHEWYNTDKFCGRLTTLIPTLNGTKTLDNYKGTFVLKRQPF